MTAQDTVDRAASPAVRVLVRGPAMTGQDTVDRAASPAVRVLSGGLR
jgi:hypothetical protein